MSADLLSKLPAFSTIPKVSAATGLGPDVYRGAIAAGHLRARRTSPQGWLRLEVAEVRRWLDKLGPDGPRKLTRPKH